MPSVQPVRVKAGWVLVPRVGGEGSGGQKKGSVTLVFTSGKETGLGSCFSPVSVSGRISEHIFFGMQNVSFPGWSHKELQQMITLILAAAMGWMGGVVCHQITAGLLA